METDKEHRQILMQQQLGQRKFCCEESEPCSIAGILKVTGTRSTELSQFKIPACQSPMKMLAILCLVGLQ